MAAQAAGKTGEEGGGRREAEGRGGGAIDSTAFFLFLTVVRTLQHFFINNHMLVYI